MSRFYARAGGFELKRSGWLSDPAAFTLCLASRVNKQLVAFNLGAGRPGGLLLACEHDTWMMAVGRSGDAGGAPTDFAEMLALAHDALPPELMGGLRQADAVGGIAVFRSPAAVWRRYEQMPRFPRGLVVVGDALCSPNPIYGQGMTMAAQQALMLHDCLQARETDLAPRFFRAAALDIGPTWARNQANDRGPSAPQAVHEAPAARPNSQGHNACRRPRHHRGRAPAASHPPHRPTHAATRSRPGALILATNLRHLHGQIFRPAFDALRRLGQAPGEVTQFERRSLDRFTRPRGAL